MTVLYSGGLCTSIFCSFIALIVTMRQCGVLRVHKGVGKARFLGRKRFAVNKAGTASLSVHCKTVVMYPLSENKVVPGLLFSSGLGLWLVVGLAERKSAVCW